VTGFSGGNSGFENVQVGTLGEEEVFLLLTPKGGSTINSSANDIGIGSGKRDISAGEGVNIDLVTDAGSDENGPTYLGHLMAIAFSVTIAMVSGTTATVFVRAVKADDDTNFDTDADPGDILADISLIRVTDVNGNSYEIAQADFVIVNGYIVLEGLQDGDTLTVIGGEPFNRIEILNGAGETVPGTTDTYDGGSFVLTGMGADVEQIISGTVHDDYLVGTEGNDYIVGMDGDDVLIGLGGMDFLEGGAGNDLFVLTDLSIHDVIVDYGAGDVIDLTRLGFELAAGEFTAAAAGEFVQYDASTGELFVDVDGAAGPEPFVLAAELATPPTSVFVRLSDGDTTADVEIA
jgi:Ca2+-binding RTX toxin-like protein